MRLEDGSARSRIAEHQNVLFPVQEMPSSSVRNCRAAFAASASDQNSAATSPKVEPILQQPLYLALAPLLAFPRDHFQQILLVAQRFPFAAAPCLRSTPAPLAGADLSAAPAEQATSTTALIATLIVAPAFPCTTDRNWPGPPAPLPPSSPRDVSSRVSMAPMHPTVSPRLLLPAVRARLHLLELRQPPLPVQNLQVSLALAAACFPAARRMPCETGWSE